MPTLAVVFAITILTQIRPSTMQAFDDLYMFHNDYFCKKIIATDLMHYRIFAFWISIASQLTANDRLVFADSFGNHLLGTALLVHDGNGVPLFSG